MALHWICFDCYIDPIRPELHRVRRVYRMMRDGANEGEVLFSYLPKLIRLAERNLSPQLRRKVDENDISATVLRTVIRRAREGLIAIEESEDFWRLLVVITLNKVRRKSRYWKAGKRSLAREQDIGSDDIPLDQLAIDKSVLQEEPSAADGEAFVQTIDLLSTQLNTQCQEVLRMKLDGLSHLQIAEKLEISTRSVTRYVATIQQTLREMSQVSNDP